MENSIILNLCSFEQAINNALINKNSNTPKIYASCILSVSNEFGMPLSLFVRASSTQLKIWKIQLQDKSICKKYSKSKQNTMVKALTAFIDYKRQKIDMKSLKQKNKSNNAPTKTTNKSISKKVIQPKTTNKSIFQKSIQPIATYIKTKIRKFFNKTINIQKPKIRLSRLKLCQLIIAPLIYRFFSLSSLTSCVGLLRLKNLKRVWKVKEFLWPLRLVVGLKMAIQSEH